MYLSAVVSCCCVLLCVVMCCVLLCVVVCKKYYVSVRSVVGIVVSIAAFQAVDPGSNPGRHSFVVLTGLVTNSLALCNCFYLAEREKY